MQSFQHVAPPLRVYSGPDSLKSLGRELDRLGSRRAVIVCGRSLSRNEALIGLLRSAMGERCAGVFAGVRAHSPVPAVQDAAEALNRLDADAVVAVGGGSAVVSARAAAILLAEGRDPAALCTTFSADGVPTSPKLAAPKLPQLVVPTTPNTATVKAGTAVFDPESGTRLALFDPKTRVQSLFIHPDFLASCSRDLLLSASLDGFAFAIEGLISRSGDPMSDALLMHSVRLTAQHLSRPDQVGEPAARADLMLAAIMCGRGTDHTGAGIATVLGHAIGARHAVENGIVKALVLPEVLRFNAEAADAGLRKVAVALDVPRPDGAGTAEAVIGALQAIFQGLGLPARLGDAGVPQEALPGLAALAMGDWFLRGSPRTVQGAAELERVLDAAW